MVKREISFGGVVVGLLFLTLAVCPGLYGQFQRGPRIVSPELHPDNTVTFRIMAPRASEVRVRGEWMPGFGTSEALIPSDSGLWSVTIGPLMPEFYGYSFLVDSVPVLDPLNGLIKRDGVRNASVLLVPGEESDLYAVKDVPHGTLSKVWYASPTLKMTRRMYVYTPPGYEESSGSYPVFYLLHGGGGDEDAWTTLGRVPQILDNLIASGTARPMIVVMTNGNAYQAAGPGDAPAVTGDTPEAPIDRSQYAGKFEESLVKDVIPYVESHYRVVANKENRAIAGLSMGGGHTIRTTNSNPGMFGYIGVFSAGAREPDEDFGRQIDALKESGVYLYWIGCGVDDFVYESTQNLLAVLDEHEFEHTYYENSGGHTWANWRIYLSVLAPQLFRH
ncbi:MAG: esterase [Gemmatimonadota bacterium]|nr:MAG: esterase [Gemmatimonadota bacterium]